MKKILKGSYIALASIVVLMTLSILSYLLTNMQTPFFNYIVGFLRFTVTGLIVFGASVSLSFYLIHIFRLGYEKLFTNNEKNS